MAQMRRTRKEGFNTGRFFYRCGAPGPSECDFFQWVDTAHGLPQLLPLPAADGVKEWIHPYANPYNENNLFSAAVHGENARRRVIAALLIRAMTLSVTGKPFVVIQLPLCHLLEKVKGHCTTKINLEEHLWPMTRRQLDQRFGRTDLDDFDVPDDEEMMSIFKEIMSRNDMIRSTVKLYKIEEGVDKGREWVDLQGLKTYMTI